MFTIAVAFLCGSGNTAAHHVESPCEYLDNHGQHRWSILFWRIGGQIDPRLKAWPRGLCPLRCSFASLRMTF
jgi:hypothetical protein